MKALAIVHEADAGPGVFAQEFKARRAKLDTWEITKGGEPPSDPRKYDAVMTFGGAMNVDEEEEHPWLADEKQLLKELLQAEKPMLGVCLGSQILCEAAGGTPRRAERPELGWLQVDVNPKGGKDPLLGPFAPRFTAFQYHSYEAPPPEGAVLLAESIVCPQAYRIGDFAWGIQFHAEVSAADALQWIKDLEAKPDSIDTEADFEQLHRDTLAAIGYWNEFGRELCGRFIEEASS